MEFSSIPGRHENTLSVVYFCVYHKSIKRELKRRLIYEYRCDERLKTKNEESTRLAWVGHYESIKRELKIGF